MEEILAAARAWMAADPDPQTREETERLLAGGEAAHQELRDCFGRRLAFGTAGIRGVLGPGPGRMNRALVRRVTAGLADYLGRAVEGSPGRGVIVGHDARRGSEVFAADTCSVLRGAGFRVIRCARHAPTPLVAFALRHLGAAAAVVVTASHNPPAYNGYKVYWENGAQIIPPHDAGIAAAIDAVEVIPWAWEPMEDAPVDLEERYLEAITAQIADVPRPRAPRSVRVVYTPLHGVGAQLCERALASEGVEVVTVPSQREPDGRFPTVAFPNPEEPGALDAAQALADERGAEVVLANDPDADRLGALVKVEGAWQRLTGDEIGLILGEALLSARGAERNRAERAFVANSIVSSDLLGRVAETLGADHIETLTGFKWIWNASLDAEAGGGRFVFGYEEALGYSVGPAVLDKDGISAAQLMARLACSTPGIWERLEGIYRRFGYVATRQRSLVDAEPGGQERMAERMGRLRAAAPETIAGARVTRCRDLADGGDGLPPADVLTWWLADDCRVILRPSGTEPKLKLYLQTVQEWGPDAWLRAQARLDAMEQDMTSRLRYDASS